MKKGKKGKSNKIKTNKIYKNQGEAEVAPAEDEMVATAPLDEYETAATAPADDAIVEPTSMTDSDIKEYSQSEYCPYEGLPVTVMIGLTKKRYTIPRPLIDKFPAL
ncbi:uncharacterized protein LDX57_002251 [Aspergillus melleus]|uniref:uncharacterized protein n=1 Tax=Aspergillus melleus TaxID=138277 RepID=UPI001E8E4D49|nr:uncharacterized protein LDX57_002251 [Aspergillus melleus]KAH8424500.1 hypothetical protein LDX57_002251 [Aspergillus melleus]